MMTRSMSLAASRASHEQQFDASLDRRFGQLHRAHIALCEVHVGRQRDGAQAFVLHDGRMRPGQPSARVEQIAGAQRRDAIEHARAAQAHRAVFADHVDLELVAFVSDAFDGAFRRAHAAGDVTAFQRRPRWA